jgi:hypothetical protein
LYLSQFDSALINKYRRVFSGSVVVTFQNFKRKYPELISYEPIENSIVFWQLYVDGNPQWQGHAGVSSKILSSNIIGTYEGNTNDKGHREGECFCQKQRTINFETNNGLRCIGFVKLNV